MDLIITAIINFIHMAQFMHKMQNNVLDITFVIKQ